MRKCGLKTIPIGGKNVSYGDVTTALKSVVKEKDIDVAIAKSYAKLKAKIPFEVWSKWFKQQYNKPDIGNVKLSDIVGESTEEGHIKDAKKLLKLLNSKKSDLTKEAKRLIAATRRNIKQVGGLTPAQVKNVIGKVRSVISTNDKLKRAEALRVRAKKRINAKLDVSQEQFLMFNKLMQIEPSLLPVEGIDMYLQIMEQLGSTKKTPTFSKTIFADTQNVLDRFSEFIQQPKEETEKVSDEGFIEKLKNAYIENIKKSKITPELGTTRLRRDFIRDVIGITKEEWAQLEPSQLETAMRSINNLKAGIGFGEPMFDIVQTVKKNRFKDKVRTPLKSVKKNIIVHGLSDLVNKTMAVFSKDKTSADIAARGLSTRVIDNSLGIKGKELFKNTFEPIASAYSKFDTDSSTAISNIDNAQKGANAQHKKTNEAIKRSALLYAYMLQEESDSNIGLDGTVDVAGSLLASAEYGRIPGRKINTQTAKIYKEIYNEFVEDGKFNKEKAYATFNKEDIRALETLRNEGEKAFPLFDFTNKVQRGGNSATYNKYVYHNVVIEPNQDGYIGTQTYNEFYSTKSGSLEERTGGAKVMVFDPYTATKRMVSGIYKDYHMTPIVSQVVGAMNEINEEFDGDENAAAVVNVLDQMLKNIFLAHNKADSWWDKAIRVAERRTGSALIASGRKWVGEALGHFGYAINNPTFFIKAVTNQKQRSFGYSGIDIAKNMGSTHVQKMYNTDMAHGSFMNKEVEGFKLDKDNQAVSDFWNNVSVLTNFFRKHNYASRATSRFEDETIAGIDRRFSRAIYYQSVEDGFKKITGEDIDFEKIRLNDEAYMAKHSEAIKEARIKADHEVSMASNTSNPFLAVPKHQRTKGDNANMRKAIDSFMQSFSFGEWAVTKEALEALVLGGEISRTRAAGILFGIHLRMSLYSTVLDVLYSSLFPGDDEEDPVWDKFKRYFVGSFLSNILGRRFGGPMRLLINFGIEQVNSNYLGFLRDDQEYDAFKHGIAFSPFNIDFLKRYSTSGADVLGKSIGQLNVPLQILDKLIKDIRTATTAKNPLKREEAVDRLKYRIPFYYLAATGKMPFKDLNQFINYLERNKLTIEDYWDKVTE